MEGYVKTRRELRPAEPNIEDGIADKPLGRMLKGNCSVQREQVAPATLSPMEKLRALGCEETLLPKILAGDERRKGRGRLKNSAATNTQQPQAKAPLPATPSRRFKI